MSLFAELKRRNVFKVAVAYIIIGWLTMQVGDTLGPALLLPGWINSALAFFLILGSQSNGCTVLIERSNRIGDVPAAGSTAGPRVRVAVTLKYCPFATVRSTPLVTICDAP